MSLPSVSFPSNQTKSNKSSVNIYINTNPPLQPPTYKRSSSDNPQQGIKPIRPILSRPPTFHTLPPEGHETIISIKTHSSNSNNSHSGIRVTRELKETYGYGKDGNVKDGMKSSTKSTQSVKLSEHVYNPPTSPSSEDAKEIIITIKTKKASEKKEKHPKPIKENAGGHIDMEQELPASDRSDVKINSIMNWIRDIEVDETLPPNKMEEKIIRPSILKPTNSNDSKDNVTPPKVKNSVSFADTLTPPRPMSFTSTLSNQETLNSQIKEENKVFIQAKPSKEVMEKLGIGKVKTVRGEKGVTCKEVRWCTQTTWTVPSGQIGNPSNHSQIHALPSGSVWSRDSKVSVPPISQRYQPIVEPLKPLKETKRTFWYA